MQLKTKFNREDEIWFLSNNKAHNSIVWQIKIHVTEEGETNIEYGCHRDKEQTKPHIYLKVEEKHAFASKQELLNSL